MLNVAIDNQTQTVCRHMCQQRKQTFPKAAISTVIINCIYIFVVCRRSMMLISLSLHTCLLAVPSSSYLLPSGFVCTNLASLSPPPHPPPAWCECVSEPDWQPRAGRGESPSHLSVIKRYFSNSLISPPVSALPTRLKIATRTTDVLSRVCVAGGTQIIINNNNV